MKKVKLVKKALLPAVIAVFCSLVALTSVSYAWFTMGNTASVDSIDVNVKAAEGIEISANALNWSDKLTLNDLKSGYDDHKNQIENIDEISPVSSIGKVTAGVQEMFYGEQNNYKLTTTQEVEGGAKNFIAFDIFVKSSVVQNFLLDATSTVTYSGNDDKKSQLATRVSFINLGTDSTYTAATAQGLGSDVSGVAKIWEPNSTVHTANSNTNTGKVTYKGVQKAGSDVAVTDTNNDIFGSVNTFDFTTVENQLQDELLFTLGVGYTKIRVYIWLEGQDVDCLNDISGSAFQVNLKFKVSQISEE